MGKKTKTRRAMAFIQREGDGIIRDNSGLVVRLSHEYRDGSSYRELAEKHIVPIYGEAGIGILTAKNLVAYVIEHGGILPEDERREIGVQHMAETRRKIGARIGKLTLERKTGVHGRTPQEMVDHAHISHIERGLVPCGISYNMGLGMTEEEFLIARRDEFLRPDGKLDAKALAEEVNKPHNYGRYPGRKPRTALQISKFFSRRKKATSKPI